VPNSIWQKVQRDADASGQLTDRLTLTLLALGHDLRQDLHLLQAYINAGQTPREGEVRFKVERNKSLIARLSKKCEQAAVMATMIRADRKNAAKRSVAIQPILMDAFEQWNPEADRKGLAFKLKASDVVVKTNPFWMGVIVSNLIGNAIQHTSAGGVGVELSGSNDHWVLTIVDSGPGFPRRSSSSSEPTAALKSRRSSGGLGMGLQLVRQAAALLEHPLSISSSPAGSIVRLHITRGASTVGLLPAALPGEALLQPRTGTADLELSP
jgi:signal transduction histidine kinase